MVGLLLSVPAGVFVYFAVIILNWLFKAIAPVFLLVVTGLGSVINALIQLMVVLAKLIVLIPLVLLFLVTRSVELVRRIFYTCPSRQCGYRGLPAFTCACGASNRRLWPNLYGVLWHPCVGCGKPLSTLDMLGRRKLQKRCGDIACDIPFHGVHAGRAPERLVGIVGGPGSGKTNYLLMAVHEIINGNGKELRGVIDDPHQAEEFEREWQQLRIGMPAAKTVDVIKAFLLYAHTRRSRFQLYLYDAPGEEFMSLSGMTRQQYFPLLEGIILLVDPLSFEAVRQEGGYRDGDAVPFRDVANNSLLKAFSEQPQSAGRKLPIRLAVVVSKADLPSVRNRIGKIRNGGSSGERCRAAIEAWGGGGELRNLEGRVEHVEYFACSALGREVDVRSREAFRSDGILPPLKWILTGEKL
jgi:hypothetical protein